MEYLLAVEEFISKILNELCEQKMFSSILWSTARLLIYETDLIKKLLAAVPGRRLVLQTAASLWSGQAAELLANAFCAATHARIQKTDPTATRSSRIAIVYAVGGVFLQLITESREMKDILWIRNVRQILELQHLYSNNVTVEEPNPPISYRHFFYLFRAPST
jgi:hypothetical protein